MEQLWEKGEMRIVQEQRSMVAASTHCLVAGFYLYPSHSWRKCLAKTGITHYFSLDLELELAAAKS